MNKKIIASSLSASLTFSPFMTMAAPSGGQVTSGNAAISQSGNITNIHQSSQNASIDWNSFNVGANETVNFVQPNTNSVTLNNIHDANPSSILGNLNANGRVFLSNPNGVIFGAGSQVNVGALIATSSKIQLQNDGSISFTDPAMGSISNQGEINTSEGGFIGFFAPDVQNQGQLNSAGGDIVLTTANSGTLFLPNSAGIGFNLDSLDSVNPLGIDNGGEIKAGGGRVLLSSDAVDTALRDAVNNDGLISVSAIQQDGGQIKLLASQGSIDQTGTLSASSIENGNGGEVLVIADQTLNAGGSIDARGGSQSGNGGFVETSGHEKIRVFGDVDTRAANGTWGTWLIDPTTLTVDNSLPLDEDGIGADNITTAQLNTYLTSNNVILQADTSIDVNDDIDSGSAAGSLTLDSASIRINADIDVENLILDGAVDLVSNSQVTLVANTIQLENGLVDTGVSSSLIINTNTLTLTGNIESQGRIELSEGTDLVLTGNSTIKTTGNSELSMRQLDVSGTGSSELTLDTEYGSVFLQEIEIADSLALFEIKRAGTDSLNTFSISGDILSDQFTFTNDNSNEQQILLADNLTINSDGAVNIGDSRFSGQNSTLSITAASIILDGIENVDTLTLNSTGNTTLTDNILVSGQNLDITASEIFIDSADADKNLKIQTTTTANLRIHSNINTTNASNLELETLDGELEVQQINNINNLTLTSTGNLTTIHGDIDINGAFSSGVTPLITLAENGDSISAASIDTQNTQIQSDSGISLEAKSSGTINLGEVSSATFTATSGTLNLYNDITTTGAIELKDSGSINLAGHSTITGQLNLATEVDDVITNVVAVNNIAGENKYDLAIVLGDQDFVLGTVGSDTSLNSFSLTGNGNLTLNGGAIPQTSGSAGVSFLGSLNLGDISAFSLDTSSSNGAINLSGLNIDTATVTLKAGSGDISLGTLGAGTAITSLVLDTSGTVNLYGNLNNAELAFDFSSASAIVLHDNIEFGTELAPLTNLNFGNATLDGNFDLTVNSAAFSVGEIGQDIALQNIMLNMGETDITIDDNLNIAGDLTINANIINIDALVSTSGGNVDFNSLAGIAMTASSEMTATDGNINMTADAGDISLSQLTALDEASITATAGNILNAVDDYQSNDQTTTNISANNINLVSGLNTGGSEASPLVLDAGNSGKIDINSGGSIFIANLSNSSITSNEDIADNTTLVTVASTDALNQIKQPTIDSVSFQHLDVVDPQWQQDDDDEVKADQTISAPRIYYSKKGWRLGNPE